MSKGGRADIVKPLRKYAFLPPAKFPRLLHCLPILFFAFWEAFVFHCLT